MSMAVLVFAVFAISGYRNVTLPRTDATAPSVYWAIAKEPGNFAILDLPTSGPSSRRIYYQTIHGRPIYGGLVAMEWTEPQGTEVVETNALVRAVERPQLAIERVGELQLAAHSLYALGFRYLVLHRDGYGEEEGYGMARSVLRDVLGPPFYEDAQMVIYRLSLSPSPGS